MREIGTADGNTRHRQWALVKIESMQPSAEKRKKLRNEHGRARTVHAFYVHRPPPSPRERTPPPPAAVYPPLALRRRHERWRRVVLVLLLLLRVPRVVRPRLV